jgi:membrane protease YdiL (CAAX protease family)
MIASLFCVAIGLGIVFAWTRSLIPSMIAHAIINTPMTPVWQGALLAVFAIGFFFAWRGGVSVFRQVFTNTKVAACAALAVLETGYAIAAGRIDSMTYVAIGMLLAAIALEAVDRRENPGVTAALAHSAD